MRIDKSLYPSRSDVRLICEANDGGLALPLVHAIDASLQRRELAASIVWIDNEFYVAQSRFSLYFFCLITQNHTNFLDSRNPQLVSDVLEKVLSADSDQRLQLAHALRFARSQNDRAYNLISHLLRILKVSPLAE